MATQNSSTKSNQNNHKVVRICEDSKGLPPTQQKPSMPPVKPPKESTNNSKKS